MPTESSFVSNEAFWEGFVQGVTGTADGGVGTPDQSNSGFVNWIQENYQGVIDSGSKLACIVDADRCPQGGGSTVVVDQGGDGDDYSKIYVVAALALVAVFILVLIFTR